MLEPERPATSGVWYRAVLTSDQVAAGLVIAIRAQFAEAVIAAGDPDGACLFVTSHDSPIGQLREVAHDEGGAADAVFFSPVSISAVPHLIVFYGAEPSSPPDRGRAALLAGKQTDWNLLPRATH